MDLGRFSFPKKIMVPDPLPPLPPLPPIIVKGSTILEFHKTLVKRKYSRLFSAENKRKSAPTPPLQELIKPIIWLKTNNSSFSYPRIADIANIHFGTDIEPEVVRRVLGKHYKQKLGGDDSSSRMAFIGMTKVNLWSMALFFCD